MSPRSKLTPAQTRKLFEAYESWRDGDQLEPVESVCEPFGISKVTMYNHLRRHGVPLLTQLPAESEESYRGLVERRDQTAEYVLYLVEKVSELDRRLRLAEWTLVENGITFSNPPPPSPWPAPEVPQA
jgi:hypothetical protein